MLEYVFMQRALICGAILGIAIPCVGVIVVYKRLSMMGDALSHSSLAGVAAGLIAGIQPVFAATIACLIAGSAIEFVRRHFHGRDELAISIIMSFGIGLAGVLSGFVPNAASFSSFLFGSIVAMGADEVWACIIAGVIVVSMCLMLRREFFLVTLDERSAKLAGVPTNFTNAIFTLVTALAISVGSRTVGALVVSSMMVIPVACAMQLARSWRNTVLLSCTIGFLVSMAGIICSYDFGLKPGGTIVLLGVALFLLILIVNKVRNYVLTAKSKKRA